MDALFRACRATRWFEQVLTVLLTLQEHFAFLEQDRYAAFDCLSIAVWRDQRGTLRVPHVDLSRYEAVFGFM